MVSSSLSSLGQTNIFLLRVHLNEIILYHKKINGGDLNLASFSL